MKIATFNIQNLFHRNKGLVTLPMNHCVHNWVDELDSLMKKHHKENRDFDRIRELSFLLGFEKVDHSRYAVLRKRNGRLYFQERGFSDEMKASNLTNWNGWVALQSIPLHETAIVNKARMIADADADILLLREVEDRASLVEFNKKMALEFDVIPYERITAIEGNNSTGLGMGILTKNGYTLESIKNHIHDLDGDGKPLFDIDCPEYTIVTPSGKEVTIVDTLLSDADADKRNAQSAQVAHIYQRLRSEGQEHVMVSGTFNDAPYSNSLAPLLRETDLRDVSKNESFNVDFDEGKDATYFRMGAYRMGVNIQQKDYLLLSPQLFAELYDCGLQRKGVWQDKKPSWTIYPSIKHKHLSASAYPLVWAKLHL